MDLHVRSEFASPPWHLAHLFPGRQLHVSDRSISVDEFARYQRRSAERDLADLVWACRDRYLYAHDLIQPAARVPERLEDGSQADVTELLYPWDKLCEQYRRLVFDAQIDLFAEQQQREFDRWQRFKRNGVKERVLACPDWTRTVLKTACLLDPLTSYDPDAIDILFDSLIDTLIRRNTHAEPTQD